MQFSQYIYIYMLPNDLKCQAYNVKLKKRNSFLSKEQNKNIINFISTLCKKINRIQED